MRSKTRKTGCGTITQLKISPPGLLVSLEITDQMKIVLPFISTESGTTSTAWPNMSMSAKELLVSNLGQGQELYPPLKSKRRSNMFYQAVRPIGSTLIALVSLKAWSWLQFWTVKRMLR